MNTTIEREAITEEANERHPERLRHLAPLRPVPRRSQELLAAVAVIAAACWGLAACGSGGGPSSVAHIGTTTTTKPAASGASPGPAGDAPGSGGSIGAGLEKFSECVRKHGIPDFAGPTVQVEGGKVSLQLGPGMKANPTFQAARAACRNLLPAGPGRQAITAQDQQDYLKGAACMRAHGIGGFPDPNFSAADGVHFAIPTGMSTTSQQFLSARHTCEKLIPAGLPYSS